MGEHDAEHWQASGQPDPRAGSHGAMKPDGLPDNPKPKATRNAKPPKPKAERGAPALYLEKGGRIHKREGKGTIPLCNFTARIVEQTTHDNGEESQTFFAVEGRLASGQALPRIEVSAGSFAGMAWVAQWGCAPSINAGYSAKDHARAAIQELSGDAPRRTVYGHTGWRRIEGEWRYLHAGGALGQDGNRRDVEVQPGAGNMAHYRLPDPPEGEELRRSIRASLSLLELAPGKPEIGALLLACIYRAPLAVAQPIDHAGFLAGYTGARKSEAAAMALAHFGQGFTARSFPANWADTVGVMESKAHAAKDALFVVDDFKPTGGKKDVDELHKKAESLFRGAGNQSGRGRLSASLKQRAAFHPRGLVLATGEDIPKGQSLRARLTIAEISRDAVDHRQGDIDLARLSELQAHARAGTLAASMAGFVRWLAPRLDEITKALPEALREYRDEAIQAGMRGHSRAASDFASLALGVKYLALFAEESGALGPQEAGELLRQCEKALRGLMEDQDEHQGNQDETTRFLALLASALSSGRCHCFDLGGVSERGTPNDRDKARVLGWAQDGFGGWGAKGPCIGWAERETLYLDGEAAYSVATGYAREQGGIIELTQIVLFRRIQERGLLARHGDRDGKPRPQIKKSIAGMKKWVYALRLSALIESDP